ncbi:MAG: adenylate/guanylate cyclase domain-containing protein, partial [bacterium]
FAKELEGTGLSDLPFNPFDSAVRRVKFHFKTARGEMSSFAATIFLAATGVDAATAIGEESKRPGWGLFFATPFAGDGDEAYIRFSGPPGVIGGSDNAFKIYSASLVAKGLVPASWLKDKIVLVGASYDDLKDTYITPYYARSTNYATMSGVEIHANILSMLLTGQFYYALHAWQAWSLAFLCALIAALATTGLSPWRAGAVFAGAWAAELALAVFAFRSCGVVIPIVAPLAAATASFGSGLGWRALTEGRQRRFIRGAFERYVPPAIVERMTENPELLKLGGEARQVTSLFTDIASFTSISERMEPTQLVAFLNEYLGRMNEELFRFGATLDKYEGDAIIAFFNAPLDVPRHELAAARAAIGIKRAGVAISARWQERCGRDIVTRIGLNAGPAVVGNMGSEGRFDYTAIGDTINLASRLEGANKFYGTTILASESVIKAVGVIASPPAGEAIPRSQLISGDCFGANAPRNDTQETSLIARPVDRVRVKGKAKPILLYEVMGTDGDIDDATKRNLVKPYTEAFAAFERRELDLAKLAIADIVTKFPGDGPARELLARCERAQREPGWDLVTELSSK